MHIFLDFERSGDLVVLHWCLFIYFFFAYPVYKISTRRNAWISTYSILYFNKLDQDGTLGRTFFDYLNTYFMLLEKN